MMKKLVEAMKKFTDSVWGNNLPTEADTNPINININPIMIEIHAIQFINFGNPSLRFNCASE